jgi:hypothetical protein
MPYRGDERAVWNRSNPQGIASNWQRWLGLGLLALAAGIAMKAYAWDTMNPALYPEVYGSMDQAAIAGLQHAYEHSMHYEYGGIIVETDKHKFRVAIPDTNWSGDRVSLAYEVEWPGYTAVGDYHTHPCMPFSHYPGVLSPPDTRSNDKGNLIGYMGDMCSGEVRRYTPGVSAMDKTWWEGTDNEQKGSYGDVVGKILLWRLDGPLAEDYPGPLAMHDW